MITTTTNHFRNQLILFFVRKISVQWLEVSSCIPPSFFQLCEMLEGMIPDCVHPLCDSVIAHVMIRFIKKFDVSLLYILSNLNISLLLDITPTIITNDLC